MNGINFEELFEKWWNGNRLYCGNTRKQRLKYKLFLYKGGILKEYNDINKINRKYLSDIGIKNRVYVLFIEEFIGYLKEEVTIKEVTIEKNRNIELDNNVKLDYEGYRNDYIRQIANDYLKLIRNELRIVEEKLNNDYVENNDLVKLNEVYVKLNNIK